MQGARTPRHEVLLGGAGNERATTRGGNLGKISGQQNCLRGDPRRRVTLQRRGSDAPGRLWESWARLWGWMNGPRAAAPGPFSCVRRGRGGKASPAHVFCYGFAPRAWLRPPPLAGPSRRGGAQGLLERDVECRALARHRRCASATKLSLRRPHRAGSAPSGSRQLERAARCLRFGGQRPCPDIVHRCTVSQARMCMRERCDGARACAQ